MQYASFALACVAMELTSKMRNAPAVNVVTSLELDSGTSIQARTYRLLRELIESGKIAPGEKLLEARVAKAFGISRSPARIALAQLCEQKLITETAGRGYQVAGCLAGEAKIANLEAVSLATEPQWQRIYACVERELCKRVLFGAVRLTEERLAEHFNVSRTVARGVVARMHGVGMLSKDPSGHWIAARITTERINHLFELRRLLEPAALMHAAPLASREWLVGAHERLDEKISRHRCDKGDMDAAETDLHIDLLSLCPNDEIRIALARTHILFVPTRYVSDRYLKTPEHSIYDALKEHRQIIGYLLDDNIEMAVQSLQDHLQEADMRWLQRFNRVRAMKLEPLPPYLSPHQA
ncbi:GntR family transcriptional regulator [Burkholderia orbicola]|uniref:GntR family transcriptional regulator n=1 Tax=Burkholderia orbicola TaxID=2978683 RepID=UPI002654B0B3|nr:GntR family transcriptional regulator [Burkholderia orbicola]MDN7560739.1 GntR family transcriptional regulator [Burkholderia orbicola]